MLFPADYPVELLEQIRQRGSEHLDHIKEAGLPAFEHVDPRWMLAGIAAGRFQSVFHAGYLIVYEVGEPWYSPNERVLDERLVLRIDDGPGNFRDVVHALEYLARKYHCTGIHVGTALQPRTAKLARVYQRYGFSPAGQSLYRRVQE